MIADSDGLKSAADRLSVNYGTLYLALLKLEQDGAIRSEWGVSDTNRKAKFYKLTPTGRKHLERETRDWHETTAILARFSFLPFGKSLVVFASARAVPP